MATTIHVPDDMMERLQREVPKGTAYHEWLARELGWDDDE